MMPRTLISNSSHNPSFLHLLITNLLWPENLSKSLQTLFFWISNLHYIVILLYFQYVSLSQQDSIASRSAPSRFPKTTTIVNILALPNSEALIRFLFAVFIIYFIILFSTAGFVLIKSRLKRELAYNQRIFVYYVSQVHSSLGFWMATAFFITALADSEVTEALSYNVVIRKMIDILIIVGSYVIGLVCALLSYDPFPSSNLLATHSSALQTIDFIAKAIMLPIIATNSDGTFALWVFGVVSFILAILRLSYLLGDFPYYCSKMMKISIRMNGIFVIISGANILGIVLRNSLKNRITNFVFTEALLVVFAIKLGNLLFQKILQNAVLIPSVQTNSQSKVLRKVFALRYILNRSKLSLKDEKEDLFQLKLWGYLNHYYKTEKDLFLQNSTNNSIFEEGRDSFDIVADRAFFSKKINFLIQKIFKDAINRTKNNSKIRILLAHHSLQLNNNLPSIMPFLTGILKSTGIQRIIAVHFLNQAGQKFEEKQKEDDATHDIDMKALIYYEEAYNFFSQKVYASTKQFLKFWEVYLGPNLELINLLQISKQIEKSDDKIHKFWTRFIEPNKQLLPSLIHLYNCYLALIRNLPEQSFKLHQKYQNGTDFLQKRLFEHFGPLRQGNLNSLGNIIVHVSLSKDKLGEIKYISANVKELLKWSQEDLISKNINTLMLPLFKEAHYKILARLLDEGPRSTIINTNLESFVQNKEGHAVPVHLYLAMHPSIHSLNELTYVLILRLRKPENEMIIFNRAGMIEGATSHISKKLSILGNNHININTICENLQDFNNTFDSQDPEFFLQIAENKSGLTSSKLPKTMRLPTDKERKPRASFNFNQQPQTLTLRFNPYDRKNEKTYSSDSFHFLTSLNIQHLFKTKLYVLNVFSTNPEDHDNEQLYCYSNSDKSSEDSNLQVKAEIPFVSENEDLQVPIEIDEPLSSNPPITDVRQTTAQGLLSPDRTDRLHMIFQGLTSRGNEGTRTFPAFNFDSSPEKPEIGETLTETVNTKKKATITQEEIVKQEKMRRVEASSTKSRRYEKTRAELEGAVYSLPKAIESRFFIVIYLGVCSLLLLSFYIENTTTLKSIGQNTLIASNWSRQLGNLVQLNEWILRYPMLDDGIFQENRFAFLYPTPLRQLATARFNVTRSQITPIQRGLRDHFSNIDENFRSLFFEEIDIYQVNSVGISVKDRRMNIFELVDQVLAAIDKIYATPYNQISYTDSPCEFITENTLNDALVHGETLITGTIQEIQGKLEKLNRLLLEFVLIAFGLAVLVVAFALYVLRVSVTDKKKISGLILHLDQEGIKRHLTVVHNFCGILEKNGMDGRKMNYLAMEKSLQQKSEKMRHQHIYREKFANKSNVNKKELQIIFIAIFLLVVLSFGFIIIRILLSKQNTKVESNIEIILACDLYQYHSILLFYSTYAYIGLNKNSMIRNLPINQSWNTSFNIVKGSLSSFATLAQENEGKDGDKDIYNILTGNLCELLQAQNVPVKTYCPTGLHGQAKKGMLQVASSIMATLYSAKTTFDSSGKTKADQVSVMNSFDLTEAEPMAYNYWFPAYGDISDLVRSKFDGDKKVFGNTVERVILVWIGLYLVLGTIVLWAVFRNLRKCREDWRKMIRLVPAAMVESNKMLKSYITQQQK